MGFLNQSYAPAYRDQPLLVFWDHLWGLSFIYGMFLPEIVQIFRQMTRQIIGQIHEYKLLFFARRFMGFYTKRTRIHAHRQCMWTPFDELM